MAFQIKGLKEKNDLEQKKKLEEQRKKEEERKLKERFTKFYIDEVEEYERFSPFLYEMILETYVLIEKFARETGRKSSGEWGISKREKWKLMTVITAFELRSAIDYYSFCVGEEYDDKQFVELLDTDDQFWQKMSAVPLHKLIALNNEEEPLLIIRRIKNLIINDAKTKNIVPEALKILGMYNPEEKVMTELLATILHKRTLGAKWMYRDDDYEIPMSDGSDFGYNEE